MKKHAKPVLTLMLLGALVVTSTEVVEVRHKPVVAAEPVHDPTEGRL